MTDPLTNRRPLASREARWARVLAARLAQSDITPNQISMGAILFGALGCGFFLLSARAGPWLGGFFLILAAAACQLRLICNLLDGMVAVEGGKSAKDGPFWNEAPDRVADALLFAGAGYAAGYPALGWVAAVLAVGTAYIRELGRAEGFPPDFSGPMAKPQRMAVLTGAAVLAAFEPIALDTPVILWAAVWIVVIGTAFTAVRRSVRLIAALEAR